MVSTRGTGTASIVQPFGMAKTHGRSIAKAIGRRATGTIDTHQVSLPSTCSRFRKTVNQSRRRSLDGNG